MTSKVKELKKMVDEKLADAREQLEKTKTDLESTVGKARKDLEERIQHAKAELDIKKESAKKSGAKFWVEAEEQKARMRARMVKFKESAEQKLGERHKKKILSKAEKAEKHAQVCIECVSVAIAEAELACLEACLARSEAEEMLKSDEKLSKSED